MEGDAGDLGAGGGADGADALTAANFTPLHQAVWNGDLAALKARLAALRPQQLIEQLCVHGADLLEGIRVRTS